MIKKLVQLNLLLRLALWPSPDYSMVYDYTHNILYLNIDGLVQERCNSIADAPELHFFALTHRPKVLW